MTAAPAPRLKPYEHMSLDELKRARRGWQDFIDTSYGWGPALGLAIEFRDKCDALINRRLRQTEGDALPPDQRPPDTHNLTEAAA